MEKQLTEIELVNKRGDWVFYILIATFFILFSPAFYMKVTDLGIPKNVSIERAINSLGKINDFDTLVEYPVNEAPIK